MAAAAKAKETTVTLLFGFGGGSPMDSAKLIDPGSNESREHLGITVRKVPAAESSLRTHLCL